MTREACHLHRLLTFLDPLLGRTPLIVEAHDCPARCLQVGHDESHSREQLPGMELNLRHYSSCGLPTGGLIEKALVPHDGFVTGPPHRARQQFLDVSLQTQRWPEAGSHTLPLALPVPRRSPAWRRQHRHETPPPCPVPVGARSPAEAFHPSPRRYVRCRVAASLPDSLPPR